MADLTPPPESGTVLLPNSCTLYWHTDKDLGRIYTSDEVGGGVIVWQPAIVSESTLLAAIVQEAAHAFLEAEIKRRSSYAQRNHS